MPVQEEEHECEEFADFWIYTYGDLVTLLLCFFVLLFSFCKTDIEKFKSVADSFKPTPPGTPFFMAGQPSVLDKVARDLDTVELPEDTFVAVDDRGIVVSFRDTVFFRPGKAVLLPSARDKLVKFITMVHALPNDILVEGHTDDRSIKNAIFPSNWELSGARAGSVARYFEEEGIKGNRITILGYGKFRPRFRNNTEQKRKLNRRIDVVIKPQDTL